MKNKIYLTAEAKQEIEAKIAQLEVTKKDIFKDRKKLYDKYKNTKHIYELMSGNSSAFSYINREQRFYKQILSSATILPVEESWDKWWNKSADNWFDELKENYPNGVVICEK
jgi:general stress protein 26